MRHPSTPDQLLDLYFGALRGGPGEERDWELFRDLFLAHAHLRTVLRSGGTEHVGDWNVDAFADHARDVYEPNGISQIETERRVETHGSAAHGWCRFESRAGSPEPELLSRGVQSIQMIELAGRWWITGVAVQLL